MVKRFSLLFGLVLALLCSCEKPSKQKETGVGTCVPVLNLDEFVFLTWYEIIDIGADDLLAEIMDPETEWKMRMLKEAGFNTYFDYRLDKYDEAEALLSLGDKTGMNIIVECPELHDPDQTGRIVNAMAEHPSLFAYNVMDEPEVSEYPEIIRRIKEIYKYDKKRPCYVNLYPNYGLNEWTEENYLNTVRHYLKSVPVSFLSFDNYPVIMVDGERTLRDAWYHNLEDIRTAAVEADVPIWAFAMTKPLGSNPKPTLADLRIQQFSNLVYGAVAFQYFTARGMLWDGSETDVYPHVKQVNHELKQMEKIFLGADIKGIWHTGKQIPRGTREFTDCPEGITGIKTGDSGTVVSYFTNNEKQYIAFVNRNCTDYVDVEISFDTDAFHVAKDGMETPVAESYHIEPGDIVIFTWE